MAFLSRSRLFGILLIMASLPMDPGAALATGMVHGGGDGSTNGGGPSDVMEARLRRIAAAVRQQQSENAGAVGDDALSYVYVGPSGLGWANGGFGNGGFGNGGFRNGGFGNGGFYNGGFRNGGFRNGGWLNGGGGFRNGGFRNGGFRNYW